MFIKKQEIFQAYITQKTRKLENGKNRIYFLFLNKIEIISVII